MFKGHILVVGAGGIGRKHIPAFLRAGWKVSACDTDPSRLESALRSFPLEATFPDFWSVDLTKFDAVLISPPAPWHVPISKRCAEEGVPFLVEKPLSTGMEGVEDLLNLVEAKSVPCAVGFTRRSVPSFRRFGELIGEGAVGEVKLATFNLSQDYPKYRPDYREIYFARMDMGGGCILDVVSHIADLAQWYLGEPGEGVALYGKLSFGPEVETEDTALVLGKFGGKFVSIVSNLFQKPYRVDVEMVGEEGNLRYISEGRDLSRILLARDDSGRWDETERFEGELPDFYLRQAEEFGKLLAGRPTPLTTLREAADNLKFCLELKRNVGPDHLPWT